VGEMVDVSFNIESREYNGKWFHNINAWKIDKPAETQTSSPGVPEYSIDDIPPEADENGGDLPF
jgi:hypothetical protein